jgi:hypothetical protein
MDYSIIRNYELLPALTIATKLAIHLLALQKERSVIH